MTENQQKAVNEKDPTKRAKIIELIEDDGKVLQGKQAEKAKLENRLNFDAGKYVRDMVETMKKVIEEMNKPKDSGANGNNQNPRKPKKTNDSNNNDSDDEIPNDVPNQTYPNKSSSKKYKNQNNQQLIIFAGIAILIIFYLLNQKDEPLSNKYEEYYDY